MMQERWWDREFYAKRAAGAALTTVQFGANGGAIMPHDPLLAQALVDALLISIARRQRQPGSP